MHDRTYFLSDSRPASRVAASTKISNRNFRTAQTVYNLSMSTDIPSQISSELNELAPDAQRRVLEYLRSLKTLGTGMSGEALAKHIGSIRPEDGREMREAIEAGCEQVNMDEW